MTIDTTAKSQEDSGVGTVESKMVPSSDANNVDSIGDGGHGENVGSRIYPTAITPEEFCNQRYGVGWHRVLYEKECPDPVHHWETCYEPVKGQVFQERKKQRKLLNLPTI